MLKKIHWVLLVLICVVATFGCNTAIKMGDSVVGFQSGKFFYTDGILRTNYHAPYERVWKACQKTLTDMKAVDIAEDKKISKGIIEAKLSDEDVRISVDYTEKNVTMVAVRVGVMGNKFTSQLIHEKIKQNLLEK
ncbi:MAG: DUF3568 family protein [Syntrophobacterales bacterium]|nr:DUF3568 family protein [Syntrophobacterales bacterium]